MKKSSFLFGCIGVLLLSAPAEAAPLYRLVDIGLLGGNYSSSQAVNNAGQVVGFAGTDPTSSVPRDAVVWANGTLTSLGTLGGTRSTALGISDNGNVVGWARDSSERTRAMLYSGGVVTDLNTVANASGWDLHYAWDVNSSGQIVGVGDGPDGGRGWLLDQGNFVDLGTLGGTRSDAYGINEAGDVVGRARTESGETHAFLYTNGMMVDLGTLGGSSSQAWDINDKGEIAGWSTDASGQRKAFIYVDGTMAELASLGGGLDQAYDINDSGQIIGQALDADGNSRAVIWIEGQAFDLNDLLVGAEGWVLDFAWAINDRGWIVGTAVDPNGVQRGFVLMPVPEPGTIMASGVGLLFILLLGARRQPA